MNPPTPLIHSVGLVVWGDPNVTMLRPSLRSNPRPEFYVESLSLDFIGLLLISATPCRRRILASAPMVNMRTPSTAQSLRLRQFVRHD